MLKGQHHSKETKEKLSKINKGKHLSEETKEKISKAGKRKHYYWKGKHFSKEVRERMSKAHKGLEVSKTHRKNLSIALTGKHYSEATKKKMSKAKKGKPSPMKGKHLSQITKEKLRKSTIKQFASGRMPNKETKIEKLIEQELKLKGLKYEKQKPLCKITITDFYLPEYKIVIYCDGDYWHSKPTVKRRDATQDLVLTMAGYTVFRFNEKEIKKSAKKCIKKVITEIITEKGIKYLEENG